VSSQELALSILLFGLPAVIFIGLIVGSRLRPAAKRRVETYFLMPMFVIIAGGAVGIAAFDRAWIQLAAFLLAFGLAAERWARRLRDDRRARPPS